MAVEEEETTPATSSGMTINSTLHLQPTDEAALDAEGLQTMRALANNMAFYLKSTEGKKAPGRGDEPWEPTHFIRP